MNITIEFYGRLKVQYSASPISWQTEATSIATVYQELYTKYQQNDDSHLLRPILNDTFSEWQQSFQDGDVIGFFPPAAGG